MYRFIALPALSVLVLAGCTTNQSWTRIDGGRADGRDLEQARFICEPRARALAQSATASSPSPINMGDAIASGINRGLAQRQIGGNVLASCMAERGFVAASRQ